MKVEVEELESYPKDSNVFHHDLWNMGTRLAKDHMIMHSFHPGEELQPFQIVNTITGERVRITITEEDSDK